MKTLGSKIKAIRETKGLTQEDVAYELEITLGAYSKIERGVTDINLSRIEQIAKFFKMSVTDLFGYGEKSEVEKLKKLLDEKDKEIMELQKKLIKAMDKK
ncbi:MAG: helix-turn-helix domain-containing protein [Cytophaga sp.]|uniref:helix-turn-helix domain-containing protein n=1 Tax=Cytophaga sp. TaxID=29535 RepID=UPI003F7D4DA4